MIPFRTFIYDAHQRLYVYLNSKFHKEAGQLEITERDRNAHNFSKAS